MQECTRSFHNQKYYYCLGLNFDDDQTDPDLTQNNDTLSHASKSTSESIDSNKSVAEGRVTRPKTKFDYRHF